MKRNLLVLCLASLGLIGCETHTQLTSGSTYLRQYEHVAPIKNATKDASDEHLDIQQAVLKAAAVEPNLNFPARIGLARIGSRGLTHIPPAELRLWSKLREELDPSFGEIILVNPMVAKLAKAGSQIYAKARTAHYISTLENVMNELRLGAARQHLDVVLVYEVLVNSKSEKNFLAITDLSIVGGYFMPSRSLEADAFANAMLIDVVQGYPYGTVRSVVEKQKGLGNTWDSTAQRASLAHHAGIKSVAKLVSEARTMLQDLRQSLTKKKAAAR